MKKLSIVLLGGIIVFTSCQMKEGAKEENNESTAVVNRNLSLAYVNSDSLAANYLYFEEVNGKLAKKKAKLEKEFVNRANGLQKQIEDYQKTANNMTIAQARAVEEDLTRKQQNLQQYQQSLTQDLLKEESKLNQDLYKRVAKYLEKYGKAHGLNFIFKHSAGGEIWYGDSSMDITKEIIDGLNEEYNSGVTTGTTNRADSALTK